MRRLRESLLSERIREYWNKLPNSVKLSGDVNSFMKNLCDFRKNSFDIPGNFWEISERVIDKIEGPCYLSNKATHNNYLTENPWVAKKRNINLIRSC